MWVPACGKRTGLFRKGRCFERIHHISDKTSGCTRLINISARRGMWRERGWTSINESVTFMISICFIWFARNAGSVGSP